MSVGKVHEITFIVLVAYARQSRQFPECHQIGLVGHVSVGDFLRVSMTMAQRSRLWTSSVTPLNNMCADMTVKEIIRACAAVAMKAYSTVSAP